MNLMKDGDKLWFLRRSLVPLLAMIPFVALTGCAGTERGPVIRIEVSHAPALFEPVKITASISPATSVVGPIEVWFDLPATAVYINGQTHWEGEIAEGRNQQFYATVAFVEEGISVVSATVRYTHPDPATNGFVTNESDYQQIRVTSQGGELDPTPVDGEASFWPVRLPYDGSEALNMTESPLLIVLGKSEGNNQLRARGLVPQEPWSWWKGTRERRGVLDPDIESRGIYVAVYDRLRPTTGYYMSASRVWGGSDALRVLGEKHYWINDEQPPESYPFVMDIVSIPPRPDWPVEARPVSPYRIFYVSKSDFRNDGVLDLAIRVNGELQGRYSVVRGAEAPSLIDLPLQFPGEAAPQ